MYSTAKPDLRQATADVYAIHAAGRWPDFQEELYTINREDRERRLLVTLRQKLLAADVAANVSRITGANVRVCEEVALEEVTGCAAILEELHRYANKVRRMTPALKVRCAM